MCRLYALVYTLSLLYQFSLIEKENLEIVLLKPGGKEQIRNSIFKFYALPALDRLGFQLQMQGWVT